MCRYLFTCITAMRVVCFQFTLACCSQLVYSFRANNQSWLKDFQQLACLRISEGRPIGSGHLTYVTDVYASGRNKRPRAFAYLLSCKAGWTHLVFSRQVKLLYIWLLVLFVEKAYGKKEHTAGSDWMFRLKALACWISCLLPL